MTKIIKDEDGIYLGILKNDIYIGVIELDTPDDDWIGWTIVRRGNTLVVGTPCNVGLLESYSMEMEEGETLDKALEELHADLRVECEDGPQYMSRLK